MTWCDPDPLAHTSVIVSPPRMLARSVYDSRTSRPRFPFAIGAESVVPIPTSA